jgi:DNA-binding response OmpR family regulator
MKRTLVVDDDPLIATLLRRLLGNLGYRVDVLRSSFGVQNAIAQWRPVLVILDVGMPALDGPAVCRLALADKRFDPPAIVLCSARSGRELEVLANDCGAVGYISKLGGPRAIDEQLRDLIARVGL